MWLLVFFLVLFLPGPVWGGGYWISEAQLTALESSLNQQIKALSEAESGLSLLSEKLRQSELKLEKSGQELELSRKDLEISEKALQEAWISYRQSEINGWIKTGAGFALGLGIGIVTGFVLFHGH